MKVRALSQGFYNERRQKPGVEFFLRKDEDFSEKWMEKVELREKPVRAKKAAALVSKEKKTDLNQEVV